MSDTIYKKINLTGTSMVSIEDAVNNAIVKANETVRNLRWFEVSEVRGSISDDLEVQWQVTVELGFGLD
jgi:flavin-binding protein dodecin